MSSSQNRLGPWLQRFLTEHVVSERNLAVNTQKSYRDSFTLLLPFLGKKLNKSVDRLNVEDITSETVLEFLAHLEKDRGCSAQTRNLRLTAIRAFARYVGSREILLVGWCSHIRAIHSKKAVSQPITWLSKQEMDALLEVPDSTTSRGRTEHALLLFLYNTGARASEAAELRVEDLQIGAANGRHALATLNGKGRKVRRCPLWPETEHVLTDLVYGRNPKEFVFLNRYQEQYTRFGIYRIVERCAAKAPALAGRKITPHVLRHTTACHLLQSGVDINTIREWLGHADISTTNIYAEIDLEMKAKAMALCEIPGAQTGKPWKEDEGLMARLKSL